MAKKTCENCIDRTICIKDGTIKSYTAKACQNHLTEIDMNDRETLRRMDAEILDALKVLETFGVKAEIKGGSYGEGSYKPKLVLQVEGTLSREERTYDDMQELEKLPPRGTIITLKGKGFEVYGYKIRAPKYPVLIREVGNPENRRKCPVNTVINAMKG